MSIKIGHLAEYLIVLVSTNIKFGSYFSPKIIIGPFALTNIFCVSEK